ncbi:unnamed protein product [Toxocara canis]|uniref:I/LWEQ domain-containing protein n=1 Tax=Toxocara canis TaxID=6265 RepID=A0A183U807_TOXCA|nr:unnamed protein product [Toxocara canis]
MVDAAQKAMNNSLERAHRSVEEGARALMHLVEETRGHVRKQLDSAYNAKQRELTIVDKKVRLSALSFGHMRQKTGGGMWRSAWELLMF